MVFYKVHSNRMFSNKGIVFAMFPRGFVCKIFYRLLCCSRFFTVKMFFAYHGNSRQRALSKE